jgi:hypothetical protein
MPKIKTGYRSRRDQTSFVTGSRTPIVGNEAEVATSDLVSAPVDCSTVRSRELPRTWNAPTYPCFSC